MLVHTTTKLSLYRNTGRTKYLLANLFIGYATHCLDIKLIYLYNNNKTIFLIVLPLNSFNIIYLLQITIVGMHNFKMAFHEFFGQKKDNN